MLHVTQEEATTNQPTISVSGSLALLEPLAGLSSLRAQPVAPQGTRSGAHRAPEAPRWCHKVHTAREGFPIDSLTERSLDFWAAWVAK